MRTLALLGIVIACAAPAAADTVASIQPAAAAVCDKAYAATKIKEKADRIRMPVAFVDWNDKTSAWTVVMPTDSVAVEFGKTDGPKMVNSADVRPPDADSVHSVVCVKRSAGPAGGFMVNLRVVEWPSGKALADWAWEARPPAEGRTADTGPNALALHFGLIYDSRVK